MSSKREYPILLNKRKRQYISSFIIFTILTGTFLIFMVVNIDAVVEFKIASTFTVEDGDFIIPGINYVPLGCGNHTIDPSNDLIEIHEISLVFDKTEYKQNRSEIYKRILEYNLNDSILPDPTLQYFTLKNTHTSTNLDGSPFDNNLTLFQQLYNGKSTTFKMPRGYGLLCIIMNIEFTNRITYMTEKNLAQVAIGIVSDNEANLKELDYSRTIITIDSIAFVPEVWDSYFNYLFLQSNITPIESPFKINFRISKTPLLLTDYLVEG